MDKFLKPEHLGVSPNSPLAYKDFAYWYLIFNAFIHSIQVNDALNIVSSTVYEYIVECDDYKSAIDTLKALYVKLKNVVFARHFSHLYASTTQ